MVAILAVPSCHTSSALRESQPCLHILAFFYVFLSVSSKAKERP